MKLHYFGYILTLAFLLPPFRQYGGRFFYYFLFLACSSLSGMILFVLFPFLGDYINQNFSMIFFSHMLLLTIQSLYHRKKIIYLLGIVYILLSFLSYYTLSYPEFFYYFILVHIVIVSYIIYYTYQFIREKSELKLYHAILILYEVSVIGKFVTLILNLESGMYYFTLSNIFHIFVALFFAFIREDKPSLSLKITKPATVTNLHKYDSLFNDEIEE